MAMQKKPRADSKLKNLPEHLQEGFWLLLHPTDAEVRPYTLEDLGGEIYDKHALSVSVSTLSEWHSWYALRLRMESAAERANQTAIELAKNSDLTPEDIERVAQTVFTAETLQAGNVKGYVALAKLRLAARALDHDARKLRLVEDAAADAKARLLALAATGKATGGLTAETLAQIEEAAGLL
jgi:hypothetical protein